MADVMLHEFNFQWQKLRARRKVLGRSGWSGSVRTLAPRIALWIASVLGLWREHSVFGAILRVGWTASATPAQGGKSSDNMEFFLLKKSSVSVPLLSRTPGQCGRISNHNLQGPFLSSLSPSQTFKSCILNSSPVFFGMQLIDLEWPESLVENNMLTG